MNIKRKRFSPHRQSFEGQTKTHIHTKKLEFFFGQINLNKSSDTVCIVQSKEYFAGLLHALSLGNILLGTGNTNSELRNKMSN